MKTEFLTCYRYGISDVDLEIFAYSDTGAGFYRFPKKEIEEIQLCDDNVITLKLKGVEKVFLIEFTTLQNLLRKHKYIEEK